jgi:hypothetical protein
VLGISFQRLLRDVTESLEAADQPTLAILMALILTDVISAYIDVANSKHSPSFPERKMWVALPTRRPSSHIPQSPQGQRPGMPAIG